MRALVTGATGFVGSHLVERLVGGGHDVHVLVRPSSDLSDVAPIASTLTVHTLDLEADALARIVETAAPEIVFHIASLVVAEHRSQDVEPLIRSNVLFPCQLVEAMAANGVCKLINCGTAWQHYQNRSYSPVCLYAATKQAFVDLLQFYVEAKGLAIIDLKLFDTYGPRDKRGKLFSLLYRATIPGERVAFSPGEQMLDFVYIDDVVDAFMIAANRLFEDSRPRFETYPVRTGQPIALRELVKTFSEVTGLSPNIGWGERSYRSREVMSPWRGGANLPGWHAKVELKDGIRRVHDDHVQGS
jgi:nucleoside-diphosphate-sugar epimerase